MKRGWFFVCCSVLLCLTLTTQWGPPEVFRLQVVAQNDSDAAQAEKLRVKRRIVQHLSPEYAHCTSIDEVYPLSLSRKEEILRIAQEAAAPGTPVSVEVGVFPFPEKSYAGIRYPPGAYRALRVTLGEGEGANWWCMLYPPLCLSEDPDTVYYSWILDKLGLNLSWKGGSPWKN